MKRFYELLFTGFYSGYFPFAPGTAGTFVAVALYAVFYLAAGECVPWVNGAVLVIMLYPSVYLCGEGEKFFNGEDPSQVVLDEIIGYFVTMLFFSFSWAAVIGGFFAFRFFDIVKPFPVRNVEKIHGGAGILFDDCVAGIYANVTVLLALVAAKHTGIDVTVSYMGVVL